MKQWLVIIIFIETFGLVLAFDQINKTEKKWEKAMANVKSYDEMLSENSKHSAVLQLTIDQLKNYQDSILRKLNETKKDLGIKDKNVQSVQYVQSYFTKTDTLILNDTVFKEPSLNVDTLIGDEWYKVNLSLKYPSTISIKPDFKSEKHIIVHTKKETINPPKKFFLFRWFQKKHKVLKVEVVEKNPYVENEKSVYYDILK